MALSTSSPSLPWRTPKTAVVARQGDTNGKGKSHSVMQVVLASGKAWEIQGASLGCIRQLLVTVTDAVCREYGVYLGGSEEEPSWKKEFLKQHT